MKAYPSTDDFMFVRYDNFVDYGNSEVYNNEVTTKIKEKNDSRYIKLKFKLLYVFSVVCTICFLLLTSQM